VPMSVRGIVRATKSQRLKSLNGLLYLSLEFSGGYKVKIASEAVAAGSNFGHLAPLQNQHCRN
jgi:hypothetical protein